MRKISIFFNWVHWATIGSVFLALIAVLWAAFLHFRLKAIYMASLSRLPVASAQILRTKFYYVKPMSAVTTEIADGYFQFWRQLLSYLPVEFTLLLILILIIIFAVGFLLYRRYRSEPSFTKIILEFKTTQSSFSLELLRLAYLPSHYRFDVHRNVVTARLPDGPFSARLALVGGVTITNLKLEICEEIRTEIPVSFWQLRKFAEFLNSQILSFYAKNGLEDVILLQSREALLSTLSLQPLGAFYSFIETW